MMKWLVWKWVKMLQQFVVTVDYTMTRNVIWIGPKEWTNLVCVTTRLIIQRKSMRKVVRSGRRTRNALGASETDDIVRQMIWSAASKHCIEVSMQSVNIFVYLLTCTHALPVKFWGKAYY